MFYEVATLSIVILHGAAMPRMSVNEYKLFKKARTRKYIKSRLCYMRHST